MKSLLIFFLRIKINMKFLLSYDGKRGINVFLKNYVNYGWEPIYEEII